MRKRVLLTYTERSRFPSPRCWTHNLSPFKLKIVVYEGIGNISKNMIKPVV